MYWTGYLYDGPLKTALIQDVVPTGKEFYRLVNDEYLPLFARAADRMRAPQVFKDKIQPSRNIVRPWNAPSRQPRKGRRGKREATRSASGVLAHDHDRD